MNRSRARARRVRHPVAAGQFYPIEPATLYSEVRSLLDGGNSVGLRGTRAVLVPHAGYVYSGGVAAAAFREVDRDFRRVVVLAANHNGWASFSGVSIPEVTHYGIPGAEIPLHGDTIAKLRKDSLFLAQPQAHTMHMIEAELPFLHCLQGAPEVPKFCLIPMIVGDLEARQIRDLAGRLSDLTTSDTLFVFSVDLSHFYKDAKARKLDAYTIDSLLGRDPLALGNAVTDGNHVLMTMAELALRMGWEPTLLQYRNSGEINGDTNKVVGYASIAFSEPIYLTVGEQRRLLEYARSEIESDRRGGVTVPMDESLLGQYPIFRLPRGVFVALMKEGRLRGCMGDLSGKEPIHRAVQTCARKAAFKDPRFPPLTAEEHSETSLSISIIDQPCPIKVGHPREHARALQPGVDGVILHYEGKQSTFLPKVWKSIPDPEDFLEELSLKQGSPRDAWSRKGAELRRYRAYEISE